MSLVPDPGLFSWPIVASPSPLADGTTWTAQSGQAARIPPPDDDVMYTFIRRPGELPGWEVASAAAGLSLGGAFIVITGTGDIYAELLAAIATCRLVGGGTILFPARSTNYTCNPIAPIEIDFSNLHFIGQGANRSVLDNISATAVDLFILKGAIRTQIHFDKSMKIQSEATAGHVFTFDAEAGFSFCNFDCPINQKNPARSLFDADFSGVAGGLFNCKFRDANWEHGTGTVWGQATAPTVPAVNIRGNNNRVVDCTWSGLRMQSRFGTVPFFRLENYGGSGWFYRNKIVEIEVERPRSGFFEITGCLATKFIDINYYDADDIDGDLIKTLTGAGGKACEQTKFEGIHRVSGLLVGVAGTEGSATIASAGGVATVTKVAHGYAAGEVVYVAGADQAEYNGRFPVASVLDADNFTVAVSGAPASPATGTITVAEAAMDIKLGDDDAQARFFDIGGTTSRQQEVDLNRRGSFAAAYTASRTTFHRPSLTQSAFFGGGSSSGILAPSIAGVEGAAVNTPSGIRIGTTGTIRTLLELSQALNFGSIAANSTAELPVTIPGAAVGDEVVANPNSAPEAGLAWNAYVSAADTVTLRLTNATIVAIDPINRTWKFRVRHTDL